MSRKSIITDCSNRGHILPKPTGIAPIVTVNWFFGINNEKLKRKRGKILQVDQLGILKKEARRGKDDPHPF